ncbi:uncharacterized protein LOC107021933 [Solanum pennellii]|uniref:Uncharacterized protein LOC107021933 n=1 Tax=Solanum pennellii TaxID=28526 RepID=A0ABM1GZF7_SOLPN|nr:uncharacterized protein LOC107021933 [Solanum pennellii]
MECYDIGDQKLKLIDISSEDDFLIDSPLFESLEDLRLSVTLDSRNENGEGSNLPRTSAKIHKSTQVNKLKGLNHSSSEPIQPGRPSYLRKSSAWDNAFFTSTGLLEPHELSSMNKEFDTLENHPLPVILEDVCARRPDQQSISSIRTGPRNMIDRSLVFKRKNINDARPERIKTQQPYKRRECNSLKLPKPWPRSSASTWQSKISSRDMYSVDIGGKKRTGPGRDLMVSNSNTHSSITSCPLYVTSAYASKHGETGKTKLSSSVSTTKTPIRSSTKSKKFENLSSSHKSPLSTTKARSLESSLSASSTNRAHSDSNSRLLLPRSQLTGPVASVPRENPQPSGLCMPSPKFGFFDEDMSVERTFDGNSNQPQKQRMSGSRDKGNSAEASNKVKRARSPLSIDSVHRDSMRTTLVLSPIKSRYAASIPKAKKASNARKDVFDVQSKYRTDKSIEIDTEVCSKLRKVGAGEHDRKRVGLVNGIVKTKEKRVKMVTKDDKAIDITITPQSQTSQGRLYESSLSMSLNLTPSRDKGITSIAKSRNQENEVNDLSRYLEAIDLNDGTETQLKQRKSFPHMRIPLVEKKNVASPMSEPLKKRYF